MLRGNITILHCITKCQKESVAQPGSPGGLPLTPGQKKRKENKTKKRKQKERKKEKERYEVRIEVRIVKELHAVPTSVF